MLHKKKLFLCLIMPASQLKPYTPIADFEQNFKKWKYNTMLHLVMRLAAIGFKTDKYLS